MNDSNPYSSPQVETFNKEEQVDGRKSPPSGMVLAVAIVNLILGTLGLLCTGFAAIGLMMMLRESRSSMTGVDVFISLSICSLPTAGCLLSGFGLLYRKQWGRILALFVAGLLGLMGFLLVGAGFASNDRIVQSTVGIVMLVYSLLVYSVLLQRKYKSEFVGTMPVEGRDT